MSIREIGRSGKSGKEQIRDYPERRKKECPEQFRESLMQNLKYQGQTQEQDGREKTGKEAQVTAARAGRLEVAGIRVNVVARQEAMQAAEVRRMSYGESDHIEIAVTEGYTLKGKLEGSHVYVEAKYDDGRLEAYQVEIDRVQAKTQHKIEQFAVETANQIKQ